MFRSVDDRLYKFGFFLAALIFISIGVINYMSSRKVNRMDSQIRRTHQVIITLNGVSEKLKNAIISHRDFLLTGNLKDLRDFRNGPAQVRLRLGQLTDLVRHDSLLYAKTLNLGNSIDAKFATLETSAVMKLNGIPGDSINRYMDEYARRNLDRIRTVANEIDEIENARLQSLTLSGEESIQIARSYIVGGNMIAFIILFLSYTLLTRQIRTRRMAEKSVREQMERLEVVTGNMGAGLSIVTSQLRILWSNTVMKTIFGDMQGKTFDLAFPGEEKKRRILLPDQLGPGERVLEERLLVDERGNKNWYQMIFTPLGEKQAGAPMFLQLLIPIDERKKMEQSLQLAKDKAEESSRAKSEFLANMSHEIRTPMNAILGYTEILKDTIPDDPKLGGYLHGIEVNGKSLIRIIDDILDLSKIEAGKMQISREMIDPRHLLAEIKTMFEESARQKGLEFRVKMGEDLPRGLELDETRMRQVLFNLIGNALKFTNSGYIELSVQTIKKKSTTGRTDLLIQVKDTGLGIPREQQELIFQPFQQQSEQDTRLYGGTGLGLAITRRLLEMMGGTISLESTVNEGSNFIIMLPDVKTGEPQAAQPATGTDIRSIRFRDPKVLLVEDNESNRKVVRDFLAGLHVHLLEAENGKIAVEMALRTHPQLIFMDIHMPVMDGFEALEQLRRHKDMARIPVIALTASAMKESREKIRETFDDFLIKPVTRVSMVHKMTGYLPYDKFRLTKKQDTFPDIESSVAAMENGGLRFSETLQAVFRKELRPVYRQIGRKRSMNRIKTFAQRLKETGLEYHVPAVEKYGDQLLALAGTFHTEMIQNLLKLYPRIDTTITGDKPDTA